MIQEQSCLLQLGPRRYVVPPNYITASLHTLRAMMDEIATVMRLRGTDLRQFLTANVQGYPATLPPPSAPRDNPTLMGPPVPPALQFTQFTQPPPPSPFPRFSQLPRFQASQVQIPQSQAAQVQTPQSHQQLQTRMFGVGPLDHVQG